MGQNWLKSNYCFCELNWFADHFVKVSSNKEKSYIQLRSHQLFTVINFKGEGDLGSTLPEHDLWHGNHAQWLRSQRAILSSFVWCSMTLLGHIQITSSFEKSLQSMLRDGPLMYDLTWETRIWTLCIFLFLFFTILTLYRLPAKGIMHLIW